MSHKVSKMAANLVGSEIIKLAGEIKEKIKSGEDIFNLTIGDFDPNIYPIPDGLKTSIIKAYQDDVTNYPPANGLEELRSSISSLLKRVQNLDYSKDEILIAGGARPLIYAAYQAIVDEGDSVVFPVPSWNNNHYTHLSHGKQIIIEATADSNFMPTADQIKPYLNQAVLIAVCSPLNPTGTVFSRDQLEGICNLILEENKKRELENRKPIYLIYDQIYNRILFNGKKHVDPISINKNMKDYTIFIDGISKYLAATGVRVGWSFGPTVVINKMKSILGHVGAWAPKAEQLATSEFLSDVKAEEEFLQSNNEKLQNSMEAIYKGVKELHAEGLGIDVIEPQAAIYLSLKLSLIGKILPDGDVITSVKQIADYLLNDAKVAIVPFYAFGTNRGSVWFRLSVGTLDHNRIPHMLKALRVSLEKLK